MKGRFGEREMEDGPLLCSSGPKRFRMHGNGWDQSECDMESPLPKFQAGESIHEIFHPEVVIQ